MSNDTLNTAEAVSRVRYRRKMTQDQLAEAAGVSVDTIKSIEGGRSGGRPATLAKLARAMNVTTTQLLVPTAGASAIRPDADTDGLLAVRRALTPPIGLELDLPSEPVRPEAWPDTLAYAEKVYSEDKYDDVLESIPVLLDEGRLLQAAGDSLPLAQGYLYTAQALTQMRRMDLANYALDKAAAIAAERSDPLLQAWAVSIQCWTMLLQRRFDEVEKLAVATADRIEPRMSAKPSYQLSTWGWLMFRASAAAIRDARTDDADMYMRQSKMAAAKLGDPAMFQAKAGWAPPPVRGYCETTVGYKTVENAILVGDAGKGIELAALIPPSDLPTVNNRHRHELDLAAAHIASGDQQGAITQLMELQSTAPEWLKHQSYARGVVNKLVANQKRAYASQVGMLADHVGVPL